jgi:hypothetical protein
LKKSAFHQQLLESDDFAQYSLRATFFVRKLRGLGLAKAIQDVGQLTKVSASFDWSKRLAYGIEPKAWARLSEKGIDPLLFFCHPRVISEQPQRLLYYRTLALISLKGLASLVGGNPAAVEDGKIERLDQGWLTKLVVALNSVLSAVAQTAGEVNATDFSGYQWASAGSTIQGSWNNSIGSQAEAAIKTILVNNLRAEIVQVVWRDGPATDYTRSGHAELIDRIGDVRVIRMNKGFHLVFASEPDVSLRNAQDLPIVAFEVKAGADPAGALERFGAALKSFDNDRNMNPRVKTVYVVRCMTPELQKRIMQNSPFDYTFSLAEILADDATQRTFANLVVRVMQGR